MLRFTRRGNEKESCNTQLQSEQKRGRREAKRNAMDEYNYQFGGN